MYYCLSQPHLRVFQLLADSLLAHFSGETGRLPLSSGLTAAACREGCVPLKFILIGGQLPETADLLLLDYEDSSLCCSSI